MTWRPIRIFGYFVLGVVFVIEVIGAESGMLMNGISWIDYGTHCGFEFNGIGPALSISEMMRHVNPGEDD